MKNGAKRITALVLCAAMTIMVLGACSSKSSEATPKKTEQQSAQGQQPSQTNAESLSMPIVKDKLTLKVFSALDAKISATLKGHNEMACYKEMEKITGIHIEWLHPPTGQETEQFNLMLASNDLPDMIWYNWTTIPGGPAKALDDKIIIKLNDQLDKYAPNIKKILNANPEAYKQSILDDGTFFQFPMYRLRQDKPEWYKTGGFMARKDWLDKLSLKAPTTIDELYTVLKAFKEKDPNGNGDPKDDIPFISNKDLSGIKNLAGAWGVMVDFYQDGGKVKYGPAEPAFKDYLSTISKWYKEGLIDPDFPATDGKSFDAKVTGDKAGVFHAALSGGMGRYLNLMQPKNTKFDLTALSWPKGPAGKPYTVQTDYNKLVPGQGTAITTANKHVAESVRWLDFHYSDQGHMLLSFGVEGESYTMKNGEPVFTDKILKNPNGLPVDQALSQYAMQIANGSMVKDSKAFVQVQMGLPQQQDAQKAWDPADKSLLLPPTTPTAQESSRLAAIMSEVNTYVNEMLTKFVMGQEPVENFDKFVESLKKMGIEEAIKINQAALDRYNQRK